MKILPAAPASKEGNLPFILITVLTLAILIISVVSLISGWLTIFQNLFYFPVILACVYYVKRGFVFSVLLACSYFFLMCIFSQDPVVLQGAFIRVLIIILVAGVITYLSIIRIRAEDALRHMTEFQEGIITNARVWLSVLDQRGKILMWNAAAEEISGYLAEEVIGKNEIWKLLYPEKDYRKQITDTITRIIRDRKYLENFETTIRSNQGNNKVISWNTKGIPDARGRISNYIAIGVDVTDRHLAGAALQESETRYRTVVEHVPDLILVHRNGLIHYVNPPALELLGYTYDELINKTIVDFIVPEYRPAVALTISKRMNGETIEPYEIEITKKSGERRTVVVRGSLIEFAGGPASLNVLTDITEQKKTANALRKSEEKYRYLIEQTEEGVWIIDGDYRTTFVNDRLAAMFGYTPQEMTEKQVREFLPADDVLVHNRRISERREGKSDRFEQKFIRKDGSVFWAIASVAPLEEENKVVGAFAMLTDITERKRAEEALRQANKNLNLLSSITRHDINNQLTVLMGYLAILEKKQPDPSFKDYFQKVATAAQRISAMIRFTKEYESIGANAPVWQDCSTLIDTAAKEAPLGKVTLKNDLPAGTEVFADPLIVKVFYNLMDNAARYGGKITIIRFAVEERDGDHIVVCEDDGYGIVTEEKEKIFERGFGKNTGLGLALAREILDITGITIRETGEPGKGARFEIVVPNGAWRMKGVNK